MSVPGFWNGTDKVARVGHRFAASENGCFANQFPAVGAVKEHLPIVDEVFLPVLFVENGVSQEGEILSRGGGIGTMRPPGERAGAIRYAVCSELAGRRIPAQVREELPPRWLREFRQRSNRHALRDHLKLSGPHRRGRTGGRL